MKFKSANQLAGFNYMSWFVKMKDLILEKLVNKTIHKYIKKNKAG